MKFRNFADFINRCDFRLDLAKIRELLKVRQIFIVRLRLFLREQRYLLEMNVDRSYQFSFHKLTTWETRSFLI